ncbi:MAG: long-chain fatty acid--CoA ligase [Nitrospirota bacterium]
MNAERLWLKSYEPGIPSTLKYPDTPLTHFLIQAAERFPDNPACIFFGKVITYRELNKLSNRFANALISLGVKKGDRVALMLPNCPQAVFAYYGALKAGAIVVQTNPLYVEREIEVQMKDSGAETIVALDLFFPRIKNIMGNTNLKRIIITGVKDYFPPLLRMLYPILVLLKERHLISVDKTPPVYDLLRLLNEAKADSPSIKVSPDDTALLQYTGGTTGIPKGVMLTHRNLVTNVLQCRNWMPSLKEGKEVFLGVTPFFHVFGMTGIMNLGIYIGAALALLPRFKTKDALHAIVKNKATIFLGVEAMYVAINNFPKIQKYDLSSIKICISGAGTLHVEVQNKFESLTGGKLVEGYGLSEASPVTHCNPIHGKRVKGSIGLPFPDTEAKIVDVETSKKVLGINEIGELIIKGPQVMKGYWNKPDETANTIRDGWLYTGDIARMDEDGFFYIEERKKDMIKTVGENVYPKEIEEVIFKHHKVQDVVVVGIPDEFKGEMVKAYIVLKNGETSTAEEIIEHCKKNLAKFKVPKEVEFRKELPKTMIGKVLRRVLKDEEMKKREK